MSPHRTFSFPNAKSIVACGDVHGDFNAVIYKLCYQYQMTDTVLIIAGDCGFGFDKPGYYDNVYNRNSSRLSKANNWVVMIRARGTRKARLHCLAFSVFWGWQQGFGTRSFALCCYSNNYESLGSQPALFDGGWEPLVSQVDENQQNTSQTVPNHGTPISGRLGLLIVSLQSADTNPKPPNNQTPTPSTWKSVLFKHAPGRTRCPAAVY